MNAKYLEVSGRTYYAFEEPEESGNLQEVGKPPVPRIVLDGTIPSFLEPKKPGFWRRQFAGNQPGTRWQEREYDWAFGFFLPLICIFFDPVVFRGWWGREGVLHDVQIFAYMLSSVSILAMAAWLLWGAKLRSLNGWLAGLFLMSGTISGILGILLLPISLVGSLFLVGALGFTPISTSIIFLRNGVRALRASVPFFEKKTLVYVVGLSGLISFVVPWVINQIWRQASFGLIDFLP